jgi:L-alanine-DL-glutamate epimerase-like enolase superfamily enzyme
MALEFKWHRASFPLAKPFRISRGAKTDALVLVLEVSLQLANKKYQAWAEAVPYGRYQESIESVSEQLAQMTQLIQSDHTSVDAAILFVQKDLLQEIIPKLPAGSARNLLDCACWDLLAKLSMCSVADLIGSAMPNKAISAQTLSVDSIQNMQQSAKELAHLPLLKVKLDGADIVQKMQVIHAACPNSQFIVDANEAWDINTLDLVLQPLKACNVVLIEQPLPAELDDPLIGYKSPIPLCADESCHTLDTVPALAKKYQALNIKLDKTGGLTGAIELLNAAKANNMQVMLGCMVGSSLSMAPIYQLAEQADFIDLDGPVLVAKDRVNGFIFDGGWMSPSPHHLWGYPDQQ